MWLYSLLATFILGVAASHGCEWNTMMIDRVIDGDTVSIRMPMLPPPLDAIGLKLRIQNVDCAETGPRARCETESLLGEAATKFTQSLLLGSLNTPTEYQVLLCGWDKYGGRVDGDILIPSHNNELPERTLSTHLLENGHGRPYNGKGKRNSWCDKEIVEVLHCEPEAV
jgi:endonuclease YncB( thermonuclease family)